MVELVQHIAETEWKRFLEGCNEATIYHTPEWKSFLEKTFDYRSHYLFATDDNAELVGLLPLFHTKSRLTGNRLCSVPFSHECGCLGEPIVCQTLLNKAIETSNQYHTDKIEIRSPVGSAVFKEINSFCTHLLDLSGGPEATWSRMDKGSVRWAINKSKKLGVTVATSTDIEDLREFYELNRITKQHLGVPCHPWKFFDGLFSILGDCVRLYLSYYQDRIIAGGIMECYKKHVLYGFGAADPHSLHVHPYNAFIWKSIEDACLQGYRSYDFGRTSYENVGLIQFKKKWGTQEKRLLYSLYPISSKTSMPNRNSSVYRAGNKLIRNMPTRFYMTFSDAVFSHFG